MNREKIATSYPRKFLDNIRNVVDLSSLTRRRLPKWIEAASIKTAYLQNTLLVLADNNRSDDEFEYVGEVDSDIEFFLEIPDYPKSSPNSRVNRRIREPGEFDAASTIESLTFDLGAGGSHLVGLEYDYHQPFILLDAQIRLTEDEKPTATRYIPLGLYIHIDEIAEPESHFEHLLPRLLESLTRIHNSAKGAEYEQKRVRKEAILGRKADSVVVLGNYDDEYKKQLIEVRDYLRGKGYESNLIDELPVPEGDDLRKKVRTWSSTARFCVMIDTKASGHNNEYEILREQETVSAILRPEGSGSTFMIGPEHSKRRKVFTYEETPLEVAPKAIEWAEDLLEDMEEEFEEYYPWRTD